MTADSVSFGLFADPHFAHRPAANGRTYENALEKIRECFAVFRREQTDFAVCMGDLVDHPDDPGAGLAELRELAAFLRGQELPCLLVTGNHDVDTLPREELFRLGGFLPVPYASFDRGGCHFVLLDTNYDARGLPYLPGTVVWDDTYLGADQLEWLRADLASHGGRHTVLLTHANLDRFCGRGAPDPHVARDANQVRAILEGCSQPVSVFQGHYHPGRFSREEGIPYYTLKSLVGMPGGYFCMTVRAGADGSLAVREWHGE